MTPALQAAVGLEALAMFRQLGLPCAITSSELCAQLGVTRSYAYEQRDRLRTSLERDPTTQACEACRDKDHAIRCHAITIAVLEYRATHPGAQVEGRRTVYSDGLRELVVSLAEANAELEQVALADACRIPLPTFKQWRAQAQPNANASSAPPPVTNVQTPADPGAAPVAVAPPAAESSTPTPTAGFSLEMIRIIREYERWEGSLPAFVEHLRRHLDLHWGREHLTQLLHLAAARALLRRPPPAPSTRGSSFRPPPGVQWTSDGKQVKVVIDGQTVEVAWQPMVDVGSTATVGEAVRVNEDTAGVVAAFEEGVATTGDAPRAMLLDNKACNTNQALRDALPRRHAAHARDAWTAPEQGRRRRKLWVVRPRPRTRRRGRGHVDDGADRADRGRGGDARVRGGTQSPPATQGGQDALRALSRSRSLTGGDRRRDEGPARDQGPHRSACGA